MEKKIRILPGGPYEITKNVPLKQAKIAVGKDGGSEHWEDGIQYPPGEQSYFLCRCGHSEKRPFCDGTHAAIGFEGEETAGHSPCLDGAIRYEGKTLDLIDKEELCASMRFCNRGATIWDAVTEGEGEEGHKLAIEEACNCAAGRLTVVDKAGNTIEPELPQEISPIQDTASGWRGPLWVKGGIAIEGADGVMYEKRNRVTLCRCGKSGNMPYCDTSHLSCPHMEGFDFL